MKLMIVFAVLFSVAYAGVIHAPAAAYVASAPVYTKTIHHQPALAPVQTFERTVQAVQHPPVTTVHQAPTSVLAKAPKISGYSYTSDVRHDATVAAAPVAVAHAAPVVAAAPVAVAHAAPVVHSAPVAVAHSAPVAYAHSAPVAYAHSAPVAVAHAPAPIVSAPTVHAAPALVAESPVVNSYSIETGRTHVASQAHYGVAHVPGVVNVPAVKAVHAAPVLAAPVAQYW